MSPDPSRSHTSRPKRGVDLALCGGAAIAAAVALVCHGSVLGSLAIACAAILLTLAVLGRRGRAVATDAVAHAETWRAIVDTATEGIVTIDAQGHIETINGAALEMFGHDATDLIGKNVNVLMPPPFTGEHDGYIARYLRTGERRIIGIGREVVGLRRDGTTFPIDLAVGEGAIDGRRFFTAVIRDITDRIALQRKLAQAERLAAVGELAAGVAHEINNPINTMINCAQLIQDGDDPTSNSKIVVEEGERIADIVRDLLQFARDDRAEAQPTSLHEVALRVQRLIGENWKRHGIALSIEVPESLPLAHARPQQMQQVLLNLLINAKDAIVNANRKVRQVALAAEEHDGGVRFSVRDSGPGIDAEVLDHIFEPFVTTKRARGGSGLGLSISKSIVESYHGQLAVESSDRGSEFTVWLPRWQPDSSTTGPP